MTMPALTKTDLLLLGLLQERPMHGYELYQQIQAEGIDDWFNVSAAGVYYSLRKLRDQGLVTESGQRKGSSSRKSVYRLTEKGRSAFFPAMEEELASRERPYLDYDLAIYLLNRIPMPRAIPPLEQRHGFLVEETQEVQAGLEAERGNGRSPLQLAILDHRRRFLEMEQAWLADVICDIQEESEVCLAEGMAGQGLMSLSGDLRDFHLPDLIRLVIFGQHTGTLTVTDGADVRTLSFEAGRLAYASYLRQGDPPESLASCEEVLEGLCELFRLQEGRFSFDQRMVYRESWHAVECSVEEVMLRGCRRVSSWDIIQRLVPSSDTIFELGSARERLDSLVLTPVEAQVMATVDGVKDVAAIARELDLTLFETSRAVYCLAAVGLLRTADLDKIRLRRAFREIAELVCSSTLAWRADPEDRSCEEEVNELCRHLPVCLQKGRIQDETDPQLGIEEMKRNYECFLETQYKVVSRRFGRANARQAYEQTVLRLSPELQVVAKRHGFDRVPAK
jgi:DNA-binding PadR family transcriptional regulator